MSQRVAPDGLFVTSTIVDHGTLLFALVQHSSLSGRNTFQQTVSAMAEWIVDARENATRATSTSSPVHGLVRMVPCKCLLTASVFAARTAQFAVVAAVNDHPEPAVSFLSDASLIQGLRSAAEYFSLLRNSSAAARLSAIADGYANDLRAAMQSALFAPPNSTSGEMLLPLLPETRELLETYSVVRAEPQTFRANGYYSIIACNLLETGMLLPTLATTIVDTLEQRDGLWRSMCRFDEGPHVGIGKCDKRLERPFERLRHSATLSADHAYTLGYWLHELQAGNATQVLEGFYGALACGNSKTFSGAEVTEPLTGDNYLTLPHLYSSTQMLRLLRAMLVFQPPFVDGASSSVAHIARGTPRAWLADGQRISVSDATLAGGGLLDFAMESHISRGLVLATIHLRPRDGPPAHTPVPAQELVLHVRCPVPEIANVSVNAALWSNFTREGEIFLGSRMAPSDLQVEVHFVQ